MNDYFGLELYQGEKRSCKTLSMCKDTFMIQQKNPKIKIFSNVWLNEKKFKNVTYIDSKDIIKLYQSNIRESIIIIDEAHIFFDSRNFAKNENKFMSYFCGQIGKRNNCLKLTTHFPSMIDIRIRNYCEKFIFCEKGYLNNYGLWNRIINYNNNDGISSEYLVMKNGFIIRKFINFGFNWIIEPEIFFYGKDYYDLYNTEIVITKKKNF